MLPPTAMNDLMIPLRAAAVSGSADQRLAGLATIRSFDAQQLLLADECARWCYWEAVPDTPDVVRAMDQLDAELWSWPRRLGLDLGRKRPTAGANLATWLASLGRDGFGRERAVGRLANEPGVDADRLLALRTGDTVEPVRERAWQAIESRLNGEQALAIMPILVRLSGRRRSATAVDRYAALYRERAGIELWSGLLSHSDRASRRWGFASGLESRGIRPQEAAEWLSRETDQLVTARLVQAIVESGDVPTLVELLRSRQATARAAAITSLPDAALSDQTVEAALFDRSARVRVAARSRASRRGIAAGMLYRRTWDERHDPRALIGAVECGERFSLAELRAYVRDDEPRVRSAATAQLGNCQLQAEDVQQLFALLDDPHPGPARRAVEVLETADEKWTYGHAVGLWHGADAVKRCRLWRLLHNRRGWDRVRADLLAAADADPAVSYLGRVSLEAWHLHVAAHMYRRPTSEQLDDIRGLLPTANLRRELHRGIEFRLGLPKPANSEPPLD